jgi:predicted Zn-dependent peptidase
MGAVLGGSFSSRLNMNLREDKGYTYGARGGFRYSRSLGSFRATASVRADATLQSLQEILAEVRALQAGSRGVTPEELEREKTGAILGLPARFATAQEVLDQYAGLAYFGLPLDEYRRYAANVSSVTLPQVVQAAATWLDPAHANILIVGDLEMAQAEHRVDEQGAGADLPRLDADGNPVTLRRGLQHLLEAGLIGAGTGQIVLLDEDGNERESLPSLPDA